jgi:integrase
MLTDTKLRQAKARSTPYKLADQGGLYLYVSSAGAKSWRYDYRFNGKRETLTIGKYPDITLAEARDIHAEARKAVARGISPAQAKRQEKETRSDTFQAIAEEWYATLASHRSESWQVSTRRWLTKELYPVIGSMLARDIISADILAVMRRLESDGTACTANYVRQTASRVFQHAIRNLRADYDPAQSLGGAVVIPRPKHRAALTAKDLPAFLETVDAYPGKLSTKIAAKLLLLTFVRKSELLEATWREVDFDQAEWRIPAERMKMKTTHIVPLSTQALECFRELHTLAFGSRFVLPHLGDLDRSMGHSTLNKMFARMGYQGSLTVHGLRATASTILNEHGFRPDIIERQLAHTERNRIRAAYNCAEYLEERRRMMQHWADYLDSLASGTVVSLRKAHLGRL